MCERCVKNREEAWAEIRDLLNFNRKVKGPLSESVEARVNELRASGDAPPEDVLTRMVESIRAQMIADRCVAVARCCEDTQFHMEPASVIMGVWAGDLMKMEVAEAMASGGGLIGLLFGGMFPGFPGPEDDDPDA